MMSLEQRLETIASLLPAAAQERFTTPLNPGESIDTRGSCLLRSLRVAAMRESGFMRARFGAEMTRGAALSQRMQMAGMSRAAMVRNSVKVPQVAHSYS